LEKRGGSFVDEELSEGTTDPYARGRSVNWFDENGDGRLDLFLGSEPRLGYPNALFENTGHGFQTLDAGLGATLSTSSSSWADWNLDGRPDLLVFQYPGAGGGAVAYENTGGAFRGIGLHFVSGRPWQSGAWGDYDGDGRPDLALVRPDRLLVLHNTPAGFQPVLDLPLQEGRSSVWFDAENDGDLDLFVVQGANTFRPGSPNEPDFLLVQRSSRHGPHFVEVAGPALRGPLTGSGESVAAADFNRDGRVDLFVTNGLGVFGASVPGQNQLFENDTTAANWAGVDLHGGTWNPWGFGATVLVRSAHLSYYREVTDGVVYHSQSESGHLVLGLGRDLSARIVVTWPDGSRDCVGGKAGQTIAVGKGRSPCPNDASSSS
jgi:hypothetical protein